MGYLIINLLKDRDAFWGKLQRDELRWSDLLELTLFIVAACALYGAVMAGWRSPLLSLYVALKLPLLFIGTTCLVALFNWMISIVLGSGLSFKATVFIVFASMVIAAWILVSLAPVALFCVLSGVPATGTHDELHYAHDCILITHIVILGIAGIAGNAALLEGLKKNARPQCPADVLFFACVTAFAFVGCQLSWILRPFVGNPFFPVLFMRPDALEQNFYEFVFKNLLPYLLGGAH